METDRPELLRTPSGTTLRFGTLVALALATTWFVAGAFAATWPPRTFLDDASCQVRADLYLTSTGSVDPDESKWAAYRDCMSGFFAPRLGWLVGGVVLLLLVATAVYVAWPKWRIRRSGLERLDSFPALWAKLSGPLDELVARAGLAKAPEFRLDAASSRAGGVAFGSSRKPVVCLDAGLVALLDRDRAGFDAVVLHELAHVRNGDVTTTYATLSAWRALLAVVLLPYLVLVVDPLLGWDFSNLDSPVTTGIVVRVVLLVVLVYLARTAVLRSRERYADALVAVWTGDADPYRTLRAVPDHRRVLRWVAIHPSLAARNAAMSDPKSLLRNGFLEALASGVAVQLAWSHLVDGLSKIDWYRSGNESFLVMRVVWGVAVATLVCVIAWRGAAYLRAGGTGRWTFLRPGLGLGLGLVVGVELELSQAGVLTPTSPLSVLAAGVLVLVTVLVCGWAGLVAVRLGDAVRSLRGALSAAAVVLVCVSFLGWFREITLAGVVWRDYLAVAYDLVSGYGRVAGVVVVPFLLNSDRVLTAAAVAVLWLVPLLLGRGSARLGVLAGLLGGAVWGVVAVVLTLTAGSTPEAATVRAAWELVAVFAVQVLVAVVVARRSEVVTALLATWVVGLVGCLGTWALHLADWQVDSVLAARPFQVLPVLGVVAALVGAVFSRDVVVPREGSGRVVVALVLVVSAVAVVWWPKAPQAALLLPDAGPEQVVDVDEAVNTWAYGGGFDRYTAVVNANDAVFKAFAAEDPALILETCDRARARAEEAAAFPEPPSPEVARTWKAGLAALVPGASECVKIYRGGEGDSQVMVDGFKEAITQLGQTLTLINQAREAATR
ncbi:M56 family metallopeptidase [Umezawaea endophytica]|uniref:M56 family metallopeptidase n=1 Tax=Umezawaea endophytica TaxID=1654476 RepID=A0A9X3AIK2_9PSEU|nr:M56 family metallopeptidase [Umezawaea endophytica]MCS7482641.1 M56 family metallopeptidase [Umezawaea endophytica]